MAKQGTNILCVTFAPLFPNAQSLLGRAHPGVPAELVDVKRLVLNPFTLVRSAMKRRSLAYGMVQDLETGEALDLIGAAVFFLNAREKQLVDLEGRTAPLGRSGGIFHLLRCLRDAAAFPFALVFFWARSVLLLSRARYRTANAPLPPDGSGYLYLRTDTFGELRSGGSVAHTVGVLGGFGELGLKPLYVSPYVIGSVSELNIPVHTVPKTSWFRNIPELPLAAYSELLSSRAKNIFSSRKPSFIYQRYSLDNYAGMVMSRRYGLPFILEYNGSDVWIARNWGVPLRFERMAEAIELANLHAATLIVVVSGAIRSELAARGIDPAKVLVNPNGVDPDRYSPAVDGMSVRSKHRLAGKTVIGFIGTFGRWHGAEVLAEAFGMLLKEHPAYRSSLRLLMIGDGMTMPLVQQALARYDAGDACVLAGRVAQEDGPAHLAACDILASPHVPNPDGTPFFGSPTKLFEYMAMGKGIVASDLDQIGEVLEHGRTAWMTRPGDAASLMQGLRTLVDDTDLRGRLGRAARQEAVAKHTWKEHTRKIIERLGERCTAADNVPSAVRGG